MRTKQCDAPSCGGTAELNRTCGAFICTICGQHVGLVRCFCGWSLTRPGAGREELEEMGETIDPD
jgi:hypothetical protein